MEKVYMSEKELKTLSLYYEKKTNEATILNYTEEEIIKYFHLINENKVYTLEEIERQKEDLGLIKELQLFNKYIIVDSKIKGIIFHKGFATNFYDYKNENESFQDFITILKILVMF